MRDVRYESVETAPSPDVYFRSCNRHSVRCSSSRGAACPRRRSVPVIAHETSLDRDLPLIGVKTMEERAADATWRTRALTWLLSLFGALALLLAAIGVFGVISQAVQQRTPEIGLRIALGATPLDIIRLVVGAPSACRSPASSPGSRSRFD